MKTSESAQNKDDDFEDLTSLLKTYMNAAGVIDPDKAPPHMRDLLAKLQDVQKLARSNQQTGTTITPEPGFVIKTVDQQGRKVFINVCGSSSVLAPGGWKDGQMSEEMRTALERAELEDPGEILRFPLSLGDFRSDQDHNGKACDVVDIVFNSDVLKQAQTFRKLKIFVIEMAMGWATEKHSVALDPNWKLPKMRYKGDKVAPQCLRLDRKPLVTDLGDVLEEPSFPLRAGKKQPSTAALVAGTSAEDPAKQGMKPQTSANPDTSAASSSDNLSGKQDGQARPQGVGLAYEVHYRGRPAEAVEVSISLEQVPASASEQVSVQVHLDQVVVHVPGGAPLELRLPFGVDANLGTAALENEGRRLVLRLPFKPYRSFLEEVRLEQEKPFDYMNCSYMQMEA